MDRTVPAALLSQLNGLDGFDEQAFLAVHAAAKAPASLRLHPSKPRSENLAAAQAVPWCPLGRYLPERPAYVFDPAWHAGAYYVQEASSMFLWHALTHALGEQTKEKWVLDLCAAPGGKSTLLQSFFADGMVVSNEIIKSRAAILVENSTKWGMGNDVITQNDPQDFAALPGFFDLMLVDAPCSGSGLFRRDPAAIDEWSTDQVMACAQRQEKILAAALPCLKAGGLLVYATCSYSPQENEAIADYLVEECGMASLTLPLDPAWQVIATTAPRSGAKGYRFYPHRLQGEGFFLAVFQKPGVAEAVYLPSQAAVLPSKKWLEQFFAGQDLPNGGYFFMQADTLRRIPMFAATGLFQLAAQLYIKKAGTALGTIKGKDALPDHEWAVSVLPKGAYPRVELSLDQALLYLRREPLAVEGPKGWVLVEHGGQVLGWAKCLPNRLNNYYPPAWRILKQA